MRRFALLMLICFWSQTIQGQDVVLKPIVFGIHRTASGLWHWQDSPLTLAGWGAKGDARYGSWHVSGNLILLRFFGLEGRWLNKFSPEHGFQWSQPTSGTIDQRDTDFSEVKIVYDAGNIDFFFGKFSQSWGPSEHSLTISNTPPTYPQFGIDWQISPSISFTHFHGELFSSLVDTHRTNTYAGIYGTQNIYVDRYLVAHRLEWTPFEQLILGFTETLVYGARRLESLYLIPFVPLLFAEHYMSDSDNLQQSADLAWKPKKDFSLYLVFLMDEWDPKLTFKKINRNWFAWQTGLKWGSMIKQRDRFRMELTWTDHRTGRHRFPMNDFYSYDYPVGHWTGPHAQSLVASYLIPIWCAWGRISYISAKRGELTRQMILDQYANVYYERFSGEHTESIHSLECTVTIEVLPKMLPDLWIEFGLNQINWKNAGFDPFRPELNTLSDISKKSITLAFFYHFNLPGHHLGSIRSLY
ncbi:capsule assembly Wzi family protein [Candidatus Neomarinimicrobiota bacterium]